MASFSVDTMSATMKAVTDKTLTKENVAQLPLSIVGQMATVAAVTHNIKALKWCINRMLDNNMSLILTVDVLARTGRLDTLVRILSCETNVFRRMEYVQSCIYEAACMGRILVVEYLMMEFTTISHDTLNSVANQLVFHPEAGPLLLFLAEKFDIQPEVEAMCAALSMGNYLALYAILERATEISCDVVRACLEGCFTHRVMTEWEDVTMLKFLLTKVLTTDDNKKFYKVYLGDFVREEADNYTKTGTPWIQTHPALYALLHEHLDIDDQDLDTGSSSRI